MRRLRSLALRGRLTWLVLAAGLLGLIVLGSLATGLARADDYANIAPASQLPSGGIVGRYPLGNYSLDEYFSAISVGLFSGVNASGVAPMIAFFLAQILWSITAFLANALITVFTFCFSLDLVGNGSPGSGALAPVSEAIHNIYKSTFGTPWLIAAIALVGIWAMWRALVQRRYAQTAGSLLVSLLYCVLALGIVLAPQATIAPASALANEMSNALLSLTSQGNLTNEGHAKEATADHLFDSLVLEPWTVLDFGGLEHCVTESEGKASSVAVRPLSSNPAQEASLSSELEAKPEIHTGGKTCINNEVKYASHFLAYAAGSKERGEEHEALENGDVSDLPASDSGRGDGSYKLGPADEPSAEAMGQGGQYQRLLLALVILAGETGAFLLLGSLAVGVLIAAMMLLLYLAFAPVALVVGVIPGRGHEFFRSWLSHLAGFLARKVIYSLILALVLAVSHALAEASSNLGWLLAFLLQAGFLWTAFLSRHRLSNELLAVTAGSGTHRDPMGRLQGLYYATRLTRFAEQRHHSGSASPTQRQPGKPASPVEPDASDPAPKKPVDDDGSPPTLGAATPERDPDGNERVADTHREPRSSRAHADDDSLEEPHDEEARRQAERRRVADPDAPGQEHRAGAESEARPQGPDQPDQDREARETPAPHRPSHTEAEADDHRGPAANVAREEAHPAPGPDGSEHDRDLSGSPEPPPRPSVAEHVGTPEPRLERPAPPVASKGQPRIEEARETEPPTEELTPEGSASELDTGVSPRLDEEGVQE